MTGDAGDKVTADVLLTSVAWSPALFERDLHDAGSLPDVCCDLAVGQSWADVHFALIESGLRWECSVDGVRVESLLSVEELSSQQAEHSLLLKVWVGPVQFNCHYFEVTAVDFDVEVSVLGDGDRFDCLVAFMDWLSIVTGSEVRLTPEGSSDSTIWSSSASEIRSIEVLRDRLRLRDLMYAPFGTYRGVFAPLSRIDNSNVDTWLATHPPDAVSAALSHVHLWDELISTNDETVLDEVARSIAGRWKETLARQFPQERFEVGVAGDPDDYGPTVWVDHVTRPTDA
jgi:hypothetical protein